MTKKDDSLWNGNWRDRRIKRVIDTIPELKTDLKRLEGKKDFPSKQEVKIIKNSLQTYKTCLEKDLERFKGRTDEKSKRKVETIRRSLRFLTSETEKPAAKTTTAQPKKAVEKPAGKRSEPKLAAPKKEPTSVKKPARAKKSAADKLLMHNDKDEMKVDSKKPIVINGANVKPKPVTKVLRRVAKSGGYTAWDDIKRNGKTFATEQEAKDYAADVLKKTGKIVPISPTDRQVTHTFKPEEEKKKK